VDDNRKKALSAALGQIEKQFGKGAIMRMGDDTTRRDIEVISTGCLGPGAQQPLSMPSTRWTPSTPGSLVSMWMIC